MDELTCDADLVDAAREHDRRAAGELLRRHRGLLVGLCHRALGDPDLAEDAAQEACVTALLSLDRLRDPARFGPWLAGIGLNVCRRWLRARTEAAWSWEALQGGTLVTATPAARDPSELVELRELGARVWQAVAALPDGQRAAVWRFYAAGLTHEETAAELGISVAAVKTRLHKGRARLRRSLWRAWREEDLRMTSSSTDGGKRGDLVEMRVTDVRKVPSAEFPDRSVVLLEEVGGTRSLAIWIGPAEAVPLVFSLTGTETPRPLTYQFTASLLRAAGGRLREVRVDRLAEGTFFATVMVESAGRMSEVDARPSDALNLALVAQTPIHVAAAVIDQADAASAENPDLPTAAALRGEGTTGARAYVKDLQGQWRQAMAALRPAHEAPPPAPGGDPGMPSGER